jgi:hypothetical protein
MKVLFRSKDFASVEGAGFGFNNRRPMTHPWQYQGRVQHRQWQGTYECHWENTLELPKNPSCIRTSCHLHHQRQVACY